MTKAIQGDKHLFLFANCIPVKGAKRSIICDLQRGRFEYIPNDLYDILISFQRKRIQSIWEHYGEENKDVVEEYLMLLLSKEYGFLGEEHEADFFPELSMDWKIPRQIQNAIIEIDRKSKHPYQRIFEQLEQVQCEALELRFYHPVEQEVLASIISMIDGSVIERVELIIAYSEQITNKNLELLAGRFPRICKFTIHSCPEEILEEVQKSDWFDATFTSQVIDSNDHCGFISPQYFQLNVSLFTESKQHNNCLNKKITIDRKGKIRNCPSLKEEYGDIRDTSLQEVVSRVDFRKYWNIHKDQIKTCRDCEFRYICSDCRAFLSDASDKFSKPERCNYNPYIAAWE